MYNYYHRRNKEIEKWDIEIFEYQPAITYFKLVPEPENTYHKNSIKIVHEETGLVGYVPRNQTKKVKELLANNPLVKGTIRGCNLRYLNYNSNQVEKGFRNYNIVV